MPRDIPTFTNCAEPGVAKSHIQLGGLEGLIITAFLQNSVLTVASILGFLAAFIFTPLGNPATWTIIAVLLVAALANVKHWYYNERLLCIEEEECVIGTVISEPTASTDGDRKLNLLLAPFNEPQCIEALRLHLDTNESMLQDSGNFNDPPFHTSAPDLPPGNERNNSIDPLRSYMATLRSKDPDEGGVDSNMFKQIVIGVVDRLMSDPDKNFFNRFYRKDANFISPNSDLHAAIPEDYDASVIWQDPDAKGGGTEFNPYRGRLESLNPMFRYDIHRDPENTGEASKKHLVPFLHCEIEGNRLAMLIDDVILALIAFIAVLIVVTALAGPIAGFFAGLIGGAGLGLIKAWIDRLFRNDGTADEPDVDVGEPLIETTGDLIALSGRWIMDTEHGQYFEIHPVRDYFLIARNVLGDEPVPIDTDEEQDEIGHENFDPTQIDSIRAQQICNFVLDEQIDRPGQIERNGSEALSYGMTTNYGGGGIRID